MGDLFRTVGAAAGVFAGTNVDDLIVLTVLFLTARASGRPRPAQIWAGQYGGIGVLVVVSIVAALGLTLVPDRWVPLLGLVPIGLGVRGLIGALRRRPDDDDPPGAPDNKPVEPPAAADNEPVEDDDDTSAVGGSAPVVAGNAIAVAGVTIANGADNIAVYTPMFRTIGVTGSVVTVAVFAVLVAVWCLAGSWLGSHRRVIEVVERYGHWLVPLVFISIGAVILSGLR